MIFSDSQSTLNSVENQFNPGDIEIKIQNKLNEALTKNKQIILMWVPGHTDVQESDLADPRAKIVITNVVTTLTYLL